MPRKCFSRFLRLGEPPNQDDVCQLGPLVPLRSPATSLLPSHVGGHQSLATVPDGRPSARGADSRGTARSLINPKWRRNAALASTCALLRSLSPLAGRLAGGGAAAYHNGRLPERSRGEEFSATRRAQWCEAHIPTRSFRASAFLRRTPPLAVLCLPSSSGEVDRGGSVCSVVWSASGPNSFGAITAPPRQCKGNR